jgi:hypothetical protein
MGKCVEKQKEATRKFRKRFFDSLAELSYPLPPGIRLTQEVRWRDAEVFEGEWPGRESLH